MLGRTNKSIFITQMKQRNESVSVHLPPNRFVSSSSQIIILLLYASLMYQSDRVLCTLWIENSNMEMTSRRHSHSLNGPHGTRTELKTAKQLKLYAHILVQNFYSFIGKLSRTLWHERHRPDMASKEKTHTHKKKKIIFHFFESSSLL